MTKQAYFYEEGPTGRIVVLDSDRTTIAACESKIWALVIVGLLNETTRVPE